MDKYPRLKRFLTEEEPSIESHLALDESVMLYYFNEMQESSDDVLRDLSNRLLNRKLFTYDEIDINDKNIRKEYEQKLINHNYDPKYYLYIDTLDQTPYSIYERETSSMIYIIDKNNNVNELSEVSEIVSAISAGKSKQETKIFFPEEIRR